LYLPLNEEKVFDIVFAFDFSYIFLLLSNYNIDFNIFEND